MSDLWGFRDFMADKFQRRICSYDMPGTGWSDPYLANQPQITAQVMEAMGEPGPFICLGSMDHGDLRCLKYCSANPSKCRAVVPVSFGASGEFQSYLDYYYPGDADKQKALVQSTCALRKGMGNIINFFAVSWGIIAALLAAPDYEPKVTSFPFCGTHIHMSGVNLSHCIPHTCIPGLTTLMILTTLQTVGPQSRSVEHLSLNHNEKQWLTNSNILAECPADLFYGYSSWAQPDLYPLPLSVPVLGFNLAQTPEQIDKTCKDWGYTVGSKDCGFLHYNYKKTIQTNKDVVARNPKSKLFLCGTDCDSANGNSFVINQNTMIPWFANTLWDAIKDIQT
jgi:pimeloyl-ACP methyl ester carboxylesterase